MNVLVAQSGGPTSAINATVVGILEMAKLNKNIDKVYGALNGIEGVLKNDFIEMNKVISNDNDLELLLHTPAAALGSCRFKLPENIQEDKLYPQIIEILRSKDINYFIYIGGNDSMDTVKKLSKYCELKNIKDIKFIGAPKTIDNDLEGTDHCPGFGSAAKYIATTFVELEKDCSVYNTPSVTIVEIMGRNTGWLTASSALARVNGGKGPNLIYLCEIPFDEDKFLIDLNKELTFGKPILIAVSEGLKNKEGEYLSVVKDGSLDAFGHKFISGTGKYLESLVRKNIGGKVRSIELNLMQRCSGHISSKTDLNESKLLGKKSLQAALEGQSGKMVGIKRMSNLPYSVDFIISDIENIANFEKKVPISWIADSKNDVRPEIIDYMKPLIEGEINLSYRNGIPNYINLY